MDVKILEPRDLVTYTGIRYEGVPSIPDIVEFGPNDAEISLSMKGSSRVLTITHRSKTLELKIGHWLYLDSDGNYYTDSHTSLYEGFRILDSPSKGIEPCDNCGSVDHYLVCRGCEEVLSD
jgi:hypothetical protein